MRWDKIINMEVAGSPISRHGRFMIIPLHATEWMNGWMAESLGNFFGRDWWAVQLQQLGLVWSGLVWPLTHFLISRYKYLTRLQIPSISPNSTIISNRLLNSGTSNQPSVRPFVDCKHRTAGFRGSGLIRRRLRPSLGLWLMLLLWGRPEANRLLIDFRFMSA